MKRSLFGEISQRLPSNVVLQHAFSLFMRRFSTSFWLSLLLPRHIAPFRTKVNRLKTGVVDAQQRGPPFLCFLGAAAESESRRENSEQENEKTADAGVVV